MGSNIPENINTRTVEGMEVLPTQPRQPKNLQGLLLFAMEATKAEDAPGNSEFGPMDEERRQFLEDALKNLTVDMAHLIRNAILVLTDQAKMKTISRGDALPADVESAFNNITEHIGDLDVANDFYKMGGFAIFPICYSSENAELRAKASTVLAEVCQNNAFCQSKALECGLLNILLSLLETEKGTALSKCLYAISCSTREYEPACRALTQQDGCEAVAQVLRSPETNARTKAAFFIRYLCNNYADAKERFIALNLVRIVGRMIEEGRDDTTEHLLSILYALTEEPNNTVLAQCRDPGLGLKGILEGHLKHPDLVSDQFIEEKDYCQQLLERIFKNYVPSPVNEEMADR